MKKTTISSALLAFSIISFNSYAGEIDANNITTFTSGTIISSSDVNTSVSEVVSQINDNNNRIAALEAKLTPSQSTVAGTYSYITFDQLLHDTGEDSVEGVNTNFAFRIKNFSTSGTITFDGNGSITSDTFNDFKSHLVAETSSNVTIFTEETSGTGIYSPNSYQVVNGDLVIDLGTEAGCSGYTLKGPVSIDGNIIALRATDVCTSGSITYTNTQQTTMILIKKAP